MIDWNYVLLASAVPIGTVVMAFVLLYLTREKPERPQPGE